jgi:hypothetical protein
VAQTPGEITASLRGLTAREGLYAVLGNHDHWTDPDTVGAAVTAAGFALLNNAHSVIRRGGAALCVLGCDDVWERKHNLGHALDGVPEVRPRSCWPTSRTSPITWHRRAGSACNFPDTATAGRSACRSRRADLPRLGQKYDMGLYTVPPPKARPVTRPSGCTSTGPWHDRPYVRFNCPPEVTLITLATPEQ